MAAPVIVQTDTFASPAAGVTQTKSITAQAGLSMIVVWLHVKPGGSGQKATGVTVNGVAATEAVGADSGNSSLARTQCFYVVSPASGTYDVVVTNSTTIRSHMTIQQITGSETTNPVRTAVAASPGSANTLPTVAVASAVDDLVLDACCSVNGDTVTATVGSDQTEKSNFIGFPGGGANSIRAVTSTEPGASSVTMSWTWSGAEFWKLGAISIKPAGGGGGGLPEPVLSAPGFAGGFQVHSGGLD